MKFSLISLGCSKNLVDSEMMMGMLSQAGYEYVKPEEAEILVINTCGFIEPAKEESIDTILESAQWKTTGSLKYLLVAGCLVQRYASDLAREIPEIDALFGVGNFTDVLEITDLVRQGSTQIVRNSPPERYLYQHLYPRQQATLPATAYVKIADGCDNRCSYCAIPFIRGRFRSRTIEDIVAECKDLVGRGVKEICLIAQDCTLYGKDLYGEFSLGRLCREIVQIQDLRWLRILYCYPSHFTEDFMNLLETHPKMCQYIDLPLQHCQTHLLKEMNRTGSKEDILELIQDIKRRMPDIVLRTSYIVGFPGETRADVEELAHFIRETEFDHVGVFLYSPEEGTAAYEKEDSISPEEKDQRRKIVMAAQQEVVARNNLKWVHKKVEVIVEKKLSHDQWIGRFRGQAPDIDGLILVQGVAEVGDLKYVEIKGLKGYDLLAVQQEGEVLA